MARLPDKIISVEQSLGRTHGLFKEGSGKARQDKPLIVLIHGGGTNALYFDNHLHSIPTDFSNLGFDVLNVNRVGYGGNPIPETKSPIFDSIPLYIELIRKVYQEHSGGKGGVILVGHSLGAAISLIIAAQSSDNFPLLGVSALGIVPTDKPNQGIVDALQNAPDGDRVPLAQPSEDSLLRFMGFPDFLDEDVITPELLPIFEPGVRSELLEWLDTKTRERFVTEVAPAVRVPLQYLAAEVELAWLSIDEGRPIFDAATKLFLNAPIVDADLLLGGAHNFEFSKNAKVLRERRVQFINGLTQEDPAAFQKIPILDLSNIDSPETKSRFLDDLRLALVNVGFFYVKNTDIPRNVTQSLIERSIGFFDLPLEEKLQVEMINSKHFLGYARLGTEITAQKADFREQADFANEVPAPGPGEPQYRNLRGPSQFPSESVLPGFKAAVETYLTYATRLSETLTSLVAEALDLPPDAFDKYFDKPQQNKLKLVKYPPPVHTEAGAEVQGVGPHQDSSFLTLLLQATDHVGLEVQNKKGAWIKAPPIKDTLVINIGRALEALTGGVCVATTHRVNLESKNYETADGRSLGPRYSLPVFQGVSLDLSSKDIDLKIPQHIRDLVQDDDVKNQAEATFNDMFKNNIGEGTFIARVTSHQDVGARWYPDVLEKALYAQKNFGKEG